MSLSQKYVIVIAGPTAVGKTTTSLQIASHLQCNIINADSRQVFQEMTIGTAVPTEQELLQCKHYFVQDRSTDSEFHAGIFEKEALGILEKEFVKSNTVIISGGSGLYIKAVLEGLDPMPDVPSTFREKYNTIFEERGLEYLQNELRDRDPEAFSALEISNPHRVIRALSFKEAIGKSIIAFQNQKPKQRDFTPIKILLARSREELYQRINSRVDDMLTAGLFEEVKSLYSIKDQNGLQTVGYKELFAVIEEKISIDEAVEKIKQNSRRYAKRQITWFKNQDQFHIFHPNQIDEILNFITIKMNTKTI